MLTAADAAELVHLETKPGNIASYRRFGFEVTGDVPLTAVEMVTMARAPVRADRGVRTSQRLETAAVRRRAASMTLSDLDGASKHRAGRLRVTEPSTTHQ